LTEETEVVEEDTLLLPLCLLQIPLERCGNFVFLPADIKLKHGVTICVH